MRGGRVKRGRSIWSQPACCTPAPRHGSPFQNGATLLHHLPTLPHPNESFLMGQVAQRRSLKKVLPSGPERSGKSTFRQECSLGTALRVGWKAERLPEAGRAVAVGAGAVGVPGGAGCRRSGGPGAGRGHSRSRSSRSSHLRLGPLHDAALRLSHLAATPCQSPEYLATVGGKSRGGSGSQRQLTPGRDKPTHRQRK